MIDPRAYGQPHIVDSYVRREDLFPAELAALGEVWPCVRGDVLDVGVGAGRTTAYLCGAARSYRAVDFNPEMVAACRRRFPDASVDVGDARDLSRHGSSDYDLVFFSFNGIDYVSPDDRPRVLSEAFRLLRPSGAFVFSSHNLTALGGKLPAFDLPHVVPTARPVKLASRVGHAGIALARRIKNRARLGHRQHFGDGWAIVNDDAHDHALLTVYVDPMREVDRLVDAGFVRPITILGMDGRVTDGDLPDAWVHFVARKPAS